MLKLRHPYARQKAPKLTKAELKALRRPPTQADLFEDAKEAYMFLTDMLIGALIEPGRNADQWCRRWIRDALAADTLKRISTRQIAWKAQRAESCFEFCRHQWETFDLCKAEKDPEPGVSVTFIDFDEPVRPNV